MRTTIPLPTRSRRALISRLCLLASLALAPCAGFAAAADDAPFATHRHAIRGLVVQVWPLDLGACRDDSTDLLVLSSEGGPPTQRRFATWLPCGAALRPGDPRIVVRELTRETVFVDVAAVPGREGPQLLSVSTDGLDVESLEGEPARVRIPIPGGLPLPIRPWAIERLPLVSAWDESGRPVALLPALGGGWLVDLTTRRTSRLELPLYARYEATLPDLPERRGPWLVQEVSWPALARADDDGDGRLDLFALSRFDVWIYRAGAEGLPARPSRKLTLVPFDEKAERRPGASLHDYQARDLDGDGLAELVMNTVAGGLAKGRSTTRIHFGRPGGASLDAKPDVLLETRGGFAGVDFIDLEGDGRLEILETSFDFGVLQLVRLLVTQRVETRVRILALDSDSPAGVETLWEAPLALALDFEQSRFAGILPAMGDWNGDGLLDLFVPRDRESIHFRLGSNAPSMPRFSATTGRQDVPLESGASRVADLDGDGLDDLVVFTTSEPGPPLVVLQNRGRLPGTPAGLRPR